MQQSTLILILCILATYAPPLFLETLVCPPPLKIFPKKNPVCGIYSGNNVAFGKLNMYNDVNV